MKQLIISTLCLCSFSISAQLAHITPDDLEAGDLFGFMLDMDGDNLIINASSSSTLSPDLGALYFYNHNGSEWQMKQKIVPSQDEVATSTRFGGWCSISGEWIATTIEGIDEISSVVFYRNLGGEWIRHSKISNDIVDSAFGWQVTLDGNRALIGAVSDFDSAGFITGAAYIYEYNVGNDEWEEVIKLSPESLDDRDFFGGAVYLKGGLAAVTARMDNDNGTRSGAVYVYENDQGLWNLAAKLKPDDGMPGDAFGYRIEGDEDRLIISGYGTDDETGSVYIFDKDNDWDQEARIYSDDLNQGDWFGSSLSLEGDRAIIGARNHYGTAASSGAVFIFESDGTDWVQTNKILDNNAQDAGYLGCGLAHENNKLVIGGFQYDNYTGAAFSLDLTNLVNTNEELDPAFILYPNPCHNELHINLNGAQIEEIEFYSAEGVLVGTHRYVGEVIDVSLLPVGSYVLKSKTDAQVLGKFLKI